MTYYYPFKIFHPLTGSNHPAKFSKLPCAYHIWKLRAINVPWIPPWYFPQQPRFRADMASNNPVSGAGNEEVNNKIAFSFLSTCIILHINLTSFNRNNANATLYNYLASLLMHYGIFFISVYLYKCYFNCRQDLAEILCVQQHFVFGSLLISLIETF